MTEPIEIIAGLGNPDPEYLTTRHNAGFWFLDALARQQGVSFRADRKLQADSCEVRIENRRLRLIKPQTFMNRSGQSISAAISYYKIPSDRLLVVYDEIDLPPGTIRLKFSGGHAGHNGVRNVIEHIGADFWRLRIGVGHPGAKERVVGHVLRRADASDEDAIIDAIMRGIDVLPTLLEQGAQRAQNILHARPPELDDAPAPDGDDTL